MTTRKLFDGVPDNLAGWILEAEDNFIELDLSKVTPTFSKVVIGGWKLEEMKLLVKIGDEWVVPATTEIKTEEFSKTYILPAAVTPAQCVWNSAAKPANFTRSKCSDETIQ